MLNPGSTTGVPLSHTAFLLSCRQDMYGRARTMLQHKRHVWPTNNTVTMQSVDKHLALTARCAELFVYCWFSTHFAERPITPTCWWILSIALQYNINSSDLTLTATKISKYFHEMLFLDLVQNQLIRFCHYHILNSRVFSSVGLQHSGSPTKFLAIPWEKQSE